MASGSGAKEFLIVSPIINYTIAGLFVAGVLYLKPKIAAAINDSGQAGPESAQ